MIPRPFCATSLIVLTLIFFSCKGKNFKNIADTVDSTLKKEVEKMAPPKKENLKPIINYSWIKKKEWQSLKDSFEGAAHLDVLQAINRVDLRHLKRLDSIIIPNDYTKPLHYYLSFPEHVDILNDVNKIILFSYPTQAFAAYEHGQLIKAGPTNMGKKRTPTPNGLFFTNWKARETRSTSNDEWILKWNFNVSNKGGVGFHEYALPGYPASHSCMRLRAEDAKYLYNWADQWILENDYKVAASGTPVIIFGKYPFGDARPWFQLVANPKAVDISVDSLNNVIQRHLQTILLKQKERQKLGDSTVSVGF